MSPVPPVVATSEIGAPPNASSPSALKAILWAGLVAGALDILYVIIFYAWQNVPANRILQSVAAGLIGRDAAFKGGSGTAGLGLALHFLIALAAAAVFYAASRRLRVLLERPIGCGLLYGVAVWLCMNLVVLPLSATPPKSFPPPSWGVGLAAHLFCVGLPIALLVRRHGR